jgi:hypothetical protein
MKFYYKRSIFVNKIFHFQYFFNLYNTILINQKKKMSDTERVEKNVDYLKILCKCKSNMRKVILTNEDKDLINTICECVYSCLNGNINNFNKLNI